MFAIISSYALCVITIWRWKLQKVDFYAALFTLKLHFKNLFVCVSVCLWNKNSISKGPNKKILQFTWVMKYTKQMFKILTSWSIFTILITLSIMAYLSKSKLVYINHWFCCNACVLPVPITLPLTALIKYVLKEA